MAKKPDPTPYPFPVTFEGRTYNATFAPASGGMVRVSVFPYGSKVAKRGAMIEEILAGEILAEAKHAGLLGGSAPSRTQNPESGA
jgi:hypothetical protein